MATLVLTAVGDVIGGPIGAAIGAFIGNQIDQSVFSTRTKGPRLSDLAVQVSSYGEAIPRLFGTLRVAGTVIWSTDLIEDKHKEGGGKGRPRSTTYSYSVSFAVVLSGRAIQSVGRIWADGNLLRGAAGDWKSEVAAFRVHLGNGTDTVDPLIASIEGSDATPVYDDLAYVVFEGLQLADFGNRIPSLTFEVVADAGPVTIGDIAAAVSDGAIAGPTAAAVQGYAALGDSVRSAVEDLAAAFGLSVTDDGAVLRLADPPAEALAIADDELGAGAPDPGTRRSIDRASLASVPDEVQLGYYDPARDWQAGLQRARLGGTPRRSEAIQLAAALDAGAAKACAEARLATLIAARATGSAALGWSRLDLRPGDDVVLPGTPASRWRIGTLSLETMVLGLSLRGVPAPSATGTSATSGRLTGTPDRIAGATTLRVLDLPALGDAPLSAPRLLIAAAGAGAGWRWADLQASLDGGASWQPIGRTALAAVLGSADGPLAGGTPFLFDDTATIEVTLLNDGMWLAGADDAALVGGANLVAIGDELIQFGSAQPLGANRFRLGRLLRGRRGTEWAMAGHTTGEPFVLLDAASLLAYDLPLSSLGATVQVMALGIGDPVPVVASLPVVGRSIRPPAPIALTAAENGAGDLAIGWTRRSRSGWTWADGGDVPLGEETESYSVAITPATGRPRSWTVATPALLYTAADRAADGMVAPLSIQVAQAGTLGLSVPAASLTINP